MKKILTIITALLLSIVAMAQYDATNKYGFWSNWSAGVSIDAATNVTSFDPNMGFGLEFDKQLSNHWYMRVMGDIPYIINDQLTNRYGSVAIGVQYFPTIKCGFYINADAGASFMLDNGNVYMMTNLGVGYNWKIGRRNNIYVEVNARENYKCSMKPDIIAKVGYAFNFGPSRMDRAIILERQRVEAEMLSHIDTIENENDRLYDELQMAKIVINDQNEVIGILQDSIILLKTSVDSLLNELNDITDYCSAPAVVFTVNSAKISRDQLQYVDFIAEMINTEDSIYVYGYADSQSGSQEFNEKLSQQRADALKEALVKRGIPEEKIVAEGHCYDILIGDSNSAATRKAIVVVKR